MTMKQQGFFRTLSVRLSVSLLTSRMFVFLLRTAVPLSIIKLDTKYPWV